MRKLVEIASITIHVNEIEFSNNMDYFKLLQKSNKYIQIRSINRMLNDVIITFSLFEEEPEMKQIQEDKDISDNIIDLEAVKAKMGSKLPPDGNWLRDLKAGTRFLAYMKLSNASALGDFILGTDPKELPAVFLGYEVGPQGFGWRWHDPVKFCKEFGFYSILEVSDGNGNTVQEGRVEGDGQLKVVDPVHETE